MSFLRIPFGCIHPSSVCAKTDRQVIPPSLSHLLPAQELRSLTPWNWDSKSNKHPPGQAALRDFERVRGLPFFCSAVAASAVAHASPLPSTANSVALLTCTAPCRLSRPTYLSRVKAGHGCTMTWFLARWEQWRAVRTTV